MLHDQRLEPVQNRPHPRRRSDLAVSAYPKSPGQHDVREQADLATRRPKDLADLVLLLGRTRIPVAGVATLVRGQRRGARDGLSGGGAWSTSNSFRLRRLGRSIRQFGWRWD